MKLHLSWNIKRWGIPLYIDRFKVKSTTWEIRLFCIGLHIFRRNNERVFLRRTAKSQKRY